MSDVIEWPDETPCAGCGWPRYCCLCPADDLSDCGECDALRAEVARLTAGIARIVDDYYADYEEDTQLALSEMREALMALLTKDGE